MWMVWETGSKSLREIGELFGGLDYAAVAQRIRRTKSTYNPIAARRLINNVKCLDVTPISSPELISSETR